MATSAGLLPGLAFAQVLPNPWYGSDTAEDLINSDIWGDSPPLATTPDQFFVPGPIGGPVAIPQTIPAYVALGSLTGQEAMVAGTQQTVPMSEMMTSPVCRMGSLQSASGIVMGLDAIDVLASVTTGAAAACSSPTSTTATSDGLAINDSSIWGSNGNLPNANQNWKWVLALLYGGLDYSTGLVDCNQASRRALVGNWSNLFQNSCPNGSPNNGGVCSDATHNNALWHAFRRDDGAGVSDIFAALVGLETQMPSPSNTSNNGFGASPYCNALNWDTNVANNGSPPCGLGAAQPGANHEQFVGPGGVLDPQSKCTFVSNDGQGFLSTSAGTPEACGAAGSGNHRMPPPGAWGTAPVGTFAGEPLGNRVSAWDVLPTSFQDNDPIRRPCLGTAANVRARSGEEVCNLDGNLGLVLAIPSSDFIIDSAAGATTLANPVQFPTATMTSFAVASRAVNVFSCAPFNTRVHGGECPNGDTTFGGGLCRAPTTGSTTQVVVQQGDLPFPTRAFVNSETGLKGTVYNLFMYDGTNADGNVAYMQEKLYTTNLVSSAVSPSFIDFIGGMYRIHEVEVVFDSSTRPANSVGCQMTTANDQIGCLVQADPCSIGVAGNGAKLWNAYDENVPPDLNATDINGAGNLTGPATDAIRVNGMYPNTTTVQALGTQVAGNGTVQQEYPMAHKAYDNSAVGFPNVTNTAELDMAQYVSSPGYPFIPSFGFFDIGSNPSSLNVPFCEDFNEALICGAATPNVNACIGNALPIPGGVSPGVSTICGNGVVEVFEECDPGVNALCSTACRCAGDAVFTGVAADPCAPVLLPSDPQ